MGWIQLDRNNIDAEHICCAFSDKKCSQGYQQKKDWLKTEFEQGYVFRRLDARAKVFIEYGPAEKAWCPVEAPGFLMLGCFWVSGQYKKQGYGKALLQAAIDDAKSQGKKGLVTVAGKKKLPFMSDTKWLLGHGFRECDRTPAGFGLYVLPLTDAPAPQFREPAKSGICPEQDGYTIYYSARCPYTGYYVSEVLPETMRKRNLPFHLIKLETLDEAGNAPTPATIFSLFYNGKFVTTDISVCVDSRFDKIIVR